MKLTAPIAFGFTLLALFSTAQAQTTVLPFASPGWRAYRLDGSNPPLDAASREWTHPLYNDTPGGATNWTATTNWIGGSTTVLNAPFQAGGIDAFVGANAVPPAAVPTDLQQNRRAYFFRKHFTVASIPAGTLFYKITWVADDGICLAVNGVEILRDNISPFTKNFGPNAAITGVENFTPATRPVSYVPYTTGQLLAGGADNVVSVCVGNENVTSSDIGFDVQIELVSAASAPVASGITILRAPYLQMATPTSMVVRWRTTANRPLLGWVRYRRAGVDGSGNPFPVSSPVAETVATTEHEVRITGLLPDTMYYYEVGYFSRNQAMPSGSEVVLLPNPPAPTGRAASFGAVNAIPIGNPAETDSLQALLTPPLLGETKLARIWVLGDSGDQNVSATAFPALVREAFRVKNANSSRTDLLLMLGDNAYDNGTDAQFRIGCFERYEEFLRKAPVWPTIGNHETTNSGEFTTPNPHQINIHPDIFTLPQDIPLSETGCVSSGREEYYSFNYANIHFVCLDSQTTSRSAAGPMAVWLEQDLQQNTQPWIVAYWHHPPYTIGTSHKSEGTSPEGASVEMRTVFVPILERYGVDLVLTGHNHHYERSKLVRTLNAASNPPTYTILNSGAGIPQASDQFTGGYYKPGVQTVVSNNNRFQNEGTIYAVVGSSSRLTSNSFTGSTPPGPHPMMQPVGVNTVNGGNYGSYQDRAGSALLEVQGNRLDFKFIDHNGIIADTFTIIKGFRLRELPPLTTWNGSYQDSVAYTISEENVVPGGVSNPPPNASFPKPGDPRFTGAFNNAWDARGSFAFNPGTGRVSGIFSGWTNTFDDELFASNHSGTRIVNGSRFLLTGYNAIPEQWTDFDTASNLPGFLQMIRGNMIAGSTYAGEAARWNATTTTGTQLGFLPGGTWSFTTSINSEGRIVGYGETTGGGIAGYRTTATGGLATASNIGANVFPYEISESGAAAGEGFGQAFLLRSTDSSVANTAWNGASGNLLGIFSGFSSSRAAGMNDRNIVVGTCYRTTVPSAQGFYWTNGRMMNLKDLLGGTTGALVAASTFAGVDVNNQGLVVVNATFSNGVTRAYVLDPAAK